MRIWNRELGIKVNQFDSHTESVKAILNIDTDIISISEDIKLVAYARKIKGFVWDLDREVEANILEGLEDNIRFVEFLRIIDMQLRGLMVRKKT